MIKFDITDKDIKNMFQYIESIDKYDDVSIPEIMKRRQGRGRKPADLSLINKLRAKEMNDIAIYVAIFLSKETTNKWSIEDIESVLENRNFIDETLIPLLEKENKQTLDLTEEQKKELAYKIQTNILQNEKETITMIGNYITERRNKNTIFVHQLSQQQLESIFNLIKDCFEIFERLIKDFNISNYLNYQQDDNNLTTTYSFMNNLINISLSTEITSSIEELTDLINSNELNENGIKSANKYINKLKKAENIFNKIAERTIIWVESNDSITDINSLENYFNQIEDEREKASKVINKYKKIKNTDIILNDGIKTEKWDYSKLMNHIKKEARLKAQSLNVNTVTNSELISISDKMAQEMIIKNPGIQDYLMEDGYHDYIGELSSLISMQLKSKYIMVGRPKGVDDEQI